MLCRNKYLFWASAVHLARMCGTLSWAWPHSLHFTSPRQLVCVSLLEYSFVGNSCLYISNTLVMVCEGHDLYLLSQLKHPFLHSCESSFLSISNFPCHSNSGTSLSSLSSTHSFNTTLTRCDGMIPPLWKTQIAMEPKEMRSYPYKEGGPFPGKFRKRYSWRKVTNSWGRQTVQVSGCSWNPSSGREDSTCSKGVPAPVAHFGKEW